jgi:tetratricopeptide (TPR) repeat protein
MPAAKKILLTLIILILAGGIGYYFWNVLRPKEEGRKEGQPPRQEIREETMPMPDLNRQINIPAKITGEARNILLQKIRQATTTLADNPKNYDQWLILGIHYKTAEDYLGSKECWEYAHYLFPNDFRPLGNLGDLYTYYLKDYAKAEDYFLQAIEKAPNQIYLYRNLYELYRYGLKDDVKAKEILRKGIENNPKASDLRELLNNY